MFNGNSGIMKIILSVLFFPLFFQDAFISFAWGAGDQLWMMLGKRLFLLLPVFAIILGCWVSIASLMTVLIRQRRIEFLTPFIGYLVGLGEIHRLLLGRDSQVYSQFCSGAGGSGQNSRSGDSVDCPGAGFYAVSSYPERQPESVRFAGSLDCGISDFILVHN